MVTLQVSYRHITILDASRPVLNALSLAASYYVKGAHFTQAFRNHYWDGRDRLIALNRKTGQYRAPIGVLEDLIATLKDANEEYHLIIHPRPAPTVQYKWAEGFELRGYQKEAVEAVVGWKPLPCLGILKMPTRSGKTRVAARIIYRMGHRALFLVPSQMLLYQTQKALAEALDMEVGLIGDSEWKERDVTVASIQTLVARRKRKAATYRELCSRYPLAIFDECHHLRGEEWRAVMMDIDAPYRVGLSATVYLHDKREVERGAIWFKACCGGIRLDVGTSDLIEAGFLVRPEIQLITIREPDLNHLGWSATLFARGISSNPHRNAIILSETLRLVGEGRRVLIVTNRLDQVEALSTGLEVARVPYRYIIGGTPAAERRERVADFVAGKANVLLGTVFGEGVDIPEVDTVINAGGGRDVKATVQRFRNLTPFEGKTSAVFIDFMDMTNAYLAEHSLERLAVYRSESAFVLRLVGEV